MNKTKHYYIINSKDKTIGETDNEFSVKPHQFNKITSFDVKEIVIPHSYYNINSTNNQINIFKVGDTMNRLAFIPFGNYTVNTLASSLKTVLDALPGPSCTWTITFNTTTNKYTIASTINTTIRGGEALTSIYKIIGFPLTDTDPGQLHIGTDIVNLSYTNHIKVYSSQLTKFDTRVRTSGNDETDLLCYLPVHNTTFGQFIRWHPRDLRFDYHPKSEDRIDITFRDEQDNLLGGSNGLNGQIAYIKLQYHTNSSNDYRKFNRYDHMDINDGAGDYYN
jgi:hypothetical protein